MLCGGEGRKGAWHEGAGYMIQRQRLQSKNQRKVGC